MASTSATGGTGGGKDNGGGGKDESGWYSWDQKRDFGNDQRLIEALHCALPSKVIPPVTSKTFKSPTINGGLVIKQY
ncbi:hypothetical protein E2C01_071704 [Portunus trituberculatus]|uniref:Uncharacterized protein n=1 Tax=Portunus trituberculatus TaxID=210409 RepID=A0A5B7I4M0_PORTR|nr:hypothetical protein [Portunus trituberculatus]